MPRPRVLVIVLAGGAGNRLELLTRNRAKPAVPFGGTHRLIDVVLSNCLHSGISDVWVIEQYNPVSVADHLANGRPWDLDRTHGGLLLLHPRQGSERAGWHEGTADALWRQAPLVRALAPEALVVVSSDALYRLDYGELVEEHLRAGADATLVTTEVDPDDAGRYGVVQAEDGRVTEYVYKPEEPRGSIVSNEVFVFRPDRVLDVLEELAGGSEEGARDLGTDAIPRLVSGGKVREHRFDGYWRDVGLVDAYWSAHMDLLRDDPPFRLDDPEWPILTRASLTAGARVRARAAVAQSVLAPGCVVEGRVERSVIGVGSVVEGDAVVRDSVVLPGAVVRAGASVHRAVLDEGVVVGAAARVGGEDAVTLLGDGAQVAAGDVVPAGGRVRGDEG